jgi:hypothetical protein
VELSALVERVDEFGPIAFLITVGGNAVPHVVSVTVTWNRADAAELVVGAGRHTSSNIGANPTVTLLWPPGTGGTYGLIVDGQARLIELAGGAKLAITPTAAVLHRTPAGDPDSPSCVTVLAR